jgi:competence protein ComQ
MGGKSLRESTVVNIKEYIYRIINENIEQAELRQLVLQFVDYQSKKGFSFGELTILHYKMLKGFETEEIYSVAAAIEFLVLSFDMLDDFEDRDSYSKPWFKDSELALNATTCLLFLSISVMRKTDFHYKERAIDLLVKFALSSITGQHKDLLNICRTEFDYIQMTLEKSGSLVSLACSIGAILATGEYPSVIDRYSKYIGLIGQINNDVKDIKTWDEKNDLLNKKYSLPIIYLLNRKGQDTQLILDYYNNKINKDDILGQKELISSMFINSGALIYAEVIKKVYQNKAINKIKSLDIGHSYVDQLLKYID